MNAKVVLSAAMLVALSACVSLGGKPPAQLLNLTSSERIAANTVVSAAPGEAIAIALPSAPQAIATTRVAVNDGPISIAYIKDAVWVEPPARLFQRLLVETVASRTGKVVIDARQLSNAPSLTLGGQLKQFGIDVATQQAVVVFDAVLSHENAKRIDTRRFEQRVSISTITALPAGAGLNMASNKVAADVAEWIAGAR